MARLSSLQGILILEIIFLFFPVFTQSANHFDVVINEAAWMGTKVSPNDEWIELYNNTNSSINFEGWILKSVDGTPEINLEGIIPAIGYYLLERTDDNTVPDISADQFYTGALSNTGEILELYDNFGNLIDKIDCSSGWFAGSNVTKQTMERKNPLSELSFNNWGTSQSPGGTPKIKNSITGESSLIKEVIKEPEAQTKPSTTESTEDKLEIIIYPLGVIISEILPSPTGPDAEEEWIEIFNQNNFEVDLSFWQISDTAGATNTYTFSEGTKILAKGFLVLARPTIKITLNNDADGLNLIQPDGKTIDSVSYEKAPRGQSYNRVNSKWIWSTTLTPGSTNIIPVPEEIEIKLKTETEKVEVKPLKVEGSEVKKEIAAIGEQMPKSFLPLLIALVIAIFSGIIILIIKKKIKQSL